MTLLFSQEGRQRLDEMVKPGLLCAFDFDGTLAPIVPQPECARLPCDIRRRLIGLSDYAPVAVITGRSVDDIRSRLALDAEFILGNHGIEGMPGWERRAQHFQQLTSGWWTQIQTWLAAAGAAGESIRLENKRYSLSVHYRLASDAAHAETMLEDVFRHLTPPPRVVAGKYVYNLLPPEAGDKGTALEQLMQSSGARCAIYVGDDVTDEDVFRLKRPDVLSVRVERCDRSDAELYLEHWQDIGMLLDELTTRLRAVHAHNWIRPQPASNA